MKRLILIACTAFALGACTDETGEGPVSATGVALDRSEADMLPDETLQLTATVTPSDAADPVVWSSDDTGVATVTDAGLVEAVAPGEAIVTVSCGRFSADCAIRVDPDFERISFEPEEGMTAIDGNLVQLGPIEVVGGTAAAKHENVFWAQPYAAEYGDPDAFMGVTFDVRLFTSDNNVWFGSYYCDYTGINDSRMDFWGGFVLSQNCNTTATSFDFKDQFSVYAASGANSTRTFAVAYCNGMMGGKYSNPVIEFAVAPRQVDHLYMAASTLLHTYYKYDAMAPGDRTFGYKITASLEGETVGSVSVELVRNSMPVDDWVKVDLSGLGKVDRLVFTPDGINPNRDPDPVYFCLDEIALVKE